MPVEAGLVRPSGNRVLLTGMVLPGDGATAAAGVSTTARTAGVSFIDPNGDL